MLNDVKTEIMLTPIWIGRNWPIDRTFQHLFDYILRNLQFQICTSLSKPESLDDFQGESCQLPIYF